MHPHLGRNLLPVPSRRLTLGPLGITLQPFITSPIAAVLPHPPSLARACHTRQKRFVAPFTNTTTAAPLPLVSTLLAAIGRNVTNQVGLAAKPAPIFRRAALHAFVAALLTDVLDAVLTDLTVRRQTPVGPHKLAARLPEPPARLARAHHAVEVSLTRGVFSDGARGAALVALRAAPSALVVLAPGRGEAKGNPAVVFVRVVDCVAARLAFQAAWQLLKCCARLANAHQALKAVIDVVVIVVFSVAAWLVFPTAVEVVVFGTHAP